MTIQRVFISRRRAPPRAHFNKSACSHPQNCYHSICPYVLVSGVVCISTSTSLLNGRAVRTSFFGGRINLLEIAAPHHPPHRMELANACLGIFIAPFILGGKPLRYVLLSQARPP